MARRCAKFSCVHNKAMQSNYTNASAVRWNHFIAHAYANVPSNIKLQLHDCKMMSLLGHNILKSFSHNSLISHFIFACDLFCDAYWRSCYDGNFLSYVLCDGNFLHHAPWASRRTVRNDHKLSTQTPIWLKVHNDCKLWTQPYVRLNRVSNVVVSPATWYFCTEMSDSSDLWVSGTLNYATFTTSCNDMTIRSRRFDDGLVRWQRNQKLHERRTGRLRESSTQCYWK